MSEVLTLSHTGFATMDPMNLLPTQETIRARASTREDLMIAVPGKLPVKDHTEWSSKRIRDMYKRTCLGDRRYSFFDVRELYELACKILNGPNLMDFVNLQKKNPYLHEVNFQLLVESAAFIYFGRRQVSISTRRSLMVPWHYKGDSKGQLSIEACYGLITGELNEIAGEVIKVKPSDLTIDKWLQHDNGFYDLMETLFTMFGHSARDPNAHF